MSWTSLFGGPAPQSSSLIEQAIAWKQQVLAEGDVSAAVRRDLALAAGQKQHGDGASKLLALGGSTKPSITVLPPASSQLQPGTRLVKSYGGATHVVEVTAGGMLYKGQLYGSLSAVAKAITGTHWNGLLFFGLRRRKVYPGRVPAHG